MNQATRAYLDCVLFIVFGGYALLFAPAAMRKAKNAQQSEKYIPMVRIAGAVVLIVGLVRLAGKLFGWGL